jgi:hypothetical protein
LTGQVTPSSEQASGQKPLKIPRHDWDLELRTS